MVDVFGSVKRLVNKIVDTEVWRKYLANRPTICVCNGKQGKCKKKNIRQNSQGLKNNSIRTTPDKIISYI